MHLFAYGTLINPETMVRVTGRTWPPATPAVLHGYAKADTDLGYPAVYAQPCAVVEGVVWPGVTGADLARLDDYEGCRPPVPAYFRRQVLVTTAEGRLPAWVYVGNPACYPVLPAE